MTDTEFEKLDAQAQRYLQRVPPAALLKKRARTLTSLALLQISERTLATMRAKGLIPYWRLSPKNYRYRISSVELALANRTVLPLTQGTRTAKMWPKPVAVFGALAPKL